MELTERSQYLWNLLDQHYPTYLVGGAVRDDLLGKQSRDFDFATLATPGEMSKIFEGHRLDFVGAHFGVLIVDGYEFATFRRDEKDDQVSFVDHIVTDLSRRDLTINAMALDRSGRLIDPFDGQYDLQNQKIRFVGDPVKRILEDPIRILRAIRFSVALSFDIDLYSLESITHTASILVTIPRERIRLELMKVMEIRTASMFFSQLAIVGALRFVIPELVECVRHTGGHHHKEGLWEHMMLAGDAVSPKYPLVKLATYLHDIGKPASYNKKDDSFLQHHKIGAMRMTKIAKDLVFSNDDVDRLTGLVRFHMHGLIRESNEKSWRKLRNGLNDSGLTWRDYLRVRIADKRANLAKDPLTITQIREYIRRLTSEKPVKMDTHQLAISGGELICKYPNLPRIQIGLLQKRLLEYVRTNGHDSNSSELLWVEADRIVSELNIAEMIK